MEKTKFAAQVLLFMTVIPVLFITTLLGNDAGSRNGNSMDREYIHENKKIDRLVISCVNRIAYVKK